MEWQLQTAKAKFSELVQKAIDKGPQTVTRRGKPAVVGAEKIALLRTELGSDAAEVLFTDMAEVGSNPARIIPAWRAFVDEHGGRPVRGIGEPIWAGRTPAERSRSRRGMHAPPMGTTTSSVGRPVRRRRRHARW